MSIDCQSFKDCNPRLHCPIFFLFKTVCQFSVSYFCVLIKKHNPMSIKVELGCEAEVIINDKTKIYNVSQVDYGSSQVAFVLRIEEKEGCFPKTIKVTMQRINEEEDAKRAKRLRTKVR